MSTKPPSYLDFLELRAKVKSWNQPISSGEWLLNMSLLDKQAILDKLRAQFEQEQMTADCARINATYGDAW